MKETEVAAAVISWFHARDEGWEIYQEVKCGTRIADIVARRGHFLWVVECKVGGFLSVLEQAMEWRGNAHLISIAMPGNYRSRHLHEIMRSVGIGFLSVHGEYVRQKAFPRLNRKIRPSLSESLHEDHKTFCPAGSRHGQWSPFKNTCREVEKFVCQNPGCSMKEMVNGIKHHYDGDIAAIASLRGWLRDTHQIPGVRYEAVGRFIVLNPILKSSPLSLDGESNPK